MRLLRSMIYRFIKLIWKKSGLRNWLIFGKEPSSLEGSQAIETPQCSQYLVKEKLKVLDIGSVQSPITGIC